MTVDAPMLVILGPTASGKSGLAGAIARTCAAEILSVDSMQVYRGMDIGTAKPSAAERAEIPHHLLDQAEPSEEFSAARFVELADRVIADAKKRNVPLIATGGTPLYYKSLFEGLFEGPAADENIRARLREMSGDLLHARLREIDPSAAARIHASDQRRLIRALEVFEITGRPISSLQQQWDSQAGLRHEAVWVGLLWEKDDLNRRINARVKEMMAAGWLDEVRSLLAKHTTLSQTARGATGYAELIEHIQGTLPLEEAIERIKIGTRQLARRQMKWFKRFRQVHWLNGDRPIEENAAQTIRLWKSALPARQVRNSK